MFECLFVYYHYEPITPAQSGHSRLLHVQSNQLAGTPALTTHLLAHSKLACYMHVGKELSENKPIKKID